MIPVWCLAIVFLLLGCSSTPTNHSTFVDASAPQRQKAPIEPPRTETKQDAASIALIRPTFNRRSVPLMRRASFSSGGVITWTPGPTRITYTDQADEISELGCRDLRPDAAPLTQYSTANLTLPQTILQGLCTGMRDLRDCYAYCCRILETARLPAHHRSGQRGPG